MGSSRVEILKHLEHKKLEVKYKIKVFELQGHVVTWPHGNKRLRVFSYTAYYSADAGKGRKLSRTREELYYQQNERTQLRVFICVMSIASLTLGSWDLMPPAG